MELLDYLGSLLYYEKNIYLQDRAISKLNNKRNRLGYAYKVHYPDKDEVDVAEHLKIIFITLGCGIFFLWALVIFVSIGGAISGKGENTVIYYIYLIILLIVLIVLIGRLVNEKINAEKTYKAKKNQYYIRVKEEEDRVKKELREKEILGVQIEKLKEIRKTTYDYLEKLYACDIIYKKYRHNIVAISAFYEYFESGRRTELTGPNGAYELYEYELRQNIIIAKLDTIINQLEYIKDNQASLYDAIREGNQKADNIYNTSLRIAENQDSINNNLSINNYYQEITAKGVTTISDIEKIKLINNNFYSN